MSNPRNRWQEWSRRFAALQQREKTLVFATLMLAILLGGYSLWIEPGMIQAENLKKSLAQQQKEQAQLLEQAATLTTHGNDPDSANRTELQRLKEAMAATEREIDTFGNTLVPPQRIPALLQTLLTRHRGLMLVSLSTLPPQPMIALPDDKSGKSSAKPPAGGAASLPGDNLYRHGIEIKLAGSYQDLLAYVADLDASPQRLLRGGMRLIVRQHPISEMTLTIYTVSLDSTWLIV